MSITYPLAAPSAPKPESFDWIFDPKIAASESVFTDAVQTYEHHGLVWAAAVTLPRLLNESAAREWHGFLTSLNGRAGTFTMGPPQHAAPRGSQAANFTVKTVAAQRAKSIEVKGMTAAATLLVGDLISIASRLYMVVEDATADGSGDATLTLSHGLRAAVAVDDAVTCLNPAGTWRLAENATPRAIEKGGVSRISFAMVEAL